MRRNMRLVKIMALMLAIAAPVFLGGCGSIRSHWGIEGDYQLPFYDNYYDGGGHKHKPKKQKHHKKHRHHDDDSEYDLSPYNHDLEIPV